MPRGLDHIVHVVRDLDAAGEFYRRAGFTVGARNRHPWGTHNRIVQFPGVFIELLAVGEPELITAARPGWFSFGGFARDFLAREEGLAMLVLEGRGAAADAAAFRSAGIGDFEVFDFEREGKRPDGTPVKVAFSLAFAADAKAPDVGYFTCQQHYPQNFWNPAFQSHANGVSGVAGVIFVAQDPAAHRHFVTSFSGVDDFGSDAGGIVVQTPRGAIEVMTPSAYRMQNGTEPPDTARGARLAALRLAVQDQSKAMSAIRDGGIASIAHDGCLVIPAGEAHGATLIFEA
jgi:hypothetical protein